MVPIPFDDFQRVDIRVGTVVRAEDFPEARPPAYRMWIDFGDLGTKTSSARITDLYAREDLPGSQVLAVVNLGPRKVAGFLSEVLVLGVDLGGSGVVLIRPDRGLAPGSRVY